MPGTCLQQLRSGGPGDRRRADRSRRPRQPSRWLLGLLALLRSAGAGRSTPVTLGPSSTPEAEFEEVRRRTSSTTRRASEILSEGLRILGDLHLRGLRGRDRGLPVHHRQLPLQRRTTPWRPSSRSPTPTSPPGSTRRRSPTTGTSETCTRRTRGCPTRSTGRRCVTPSRSARRGTGIRPHAQGDRVPRSLIVSLSELRVRQGGGEAVARAAGSARPSTSRASRTSTASAGRVRGRRRALPRAAERLSRVSGLDPRVLFKLADCYEALDRLDEADRIYRTIVVHYPESPYAFRAQRADRLEPRGDSGPRPPEASRPRLRGSYVTTGPNPALRSPERSASPTSSAGAASSGAIARRGRSRHLERLLETRSGFADVHYMVGACTSAGTTSSAPSGASSEALRINPVYTEALIALASLCSSGAASTTGVARALRARRARQRGRLRRLSTAPPAASSPTSRPSWATPCVEAGELAQAIDAYRKARSERCPEFHDIRYRLGIALREAGRPDRRPGGVPPRAAAATPASSRRACSSASPSTRWGVSPEAVEVVGERPGARAQEHSGCGHVSAHGGGPAGHGSAPVSSVVVRA